MEAAMTTRKEEPGDTAGTAQVYKDTKEARIQLEDNLTYEEAQQVPMKMRSDGSHMTEQILHLTLEIISLLTGEDYMVVKKTSDDHVISSQCSIEDLLPSCLIPEKNNDKKILEVINKIIQLLTGEVGDVSEDIHHHHDEGPCDGDPSSLGCSEARNLTMLPTLEASDGFVTPYTKIVDKEGLLIECKSQNNTVVEGSSNEHCRASTSTKKQTDLVGAQRGDDLNWQGATKGTQTEWHSTYILVYNTNALSTQTPDIKINTAVKGFDKKLANFSGQRIHMNHSETPSTFGNSSKKQIDSQEKWNCVECGKLFQCKSHLTKHQRIYKEISCNSSKASGIVNRDGHQADQRDTHWTSHVSRPQGTHNGERLCHTSDSMITIVDNSDLAECEVDIRDHQAGSYHNDELQADSLVCSSGLGGHQILNQEKAMAIDFFSCRSNLVRNRKVHTGEKLFLCSECGKRFSLKSALLRHQMIHTGEKPFACNICGKRFNQHSHYIRHQLSHSGKKPFTCSDCSKSFIQKSDLVKHQKGHKGKKLSCPVCRKEFCSKMFLVKHQKSHGESNRAVCSECGKCFSQKSALVVHQRIHTGEKPFSCDHCGKLFNRKSLLVRHQRVHTGEKPFSCRECGKSFTRTTNLIIHQRTHSGKKPYSCPTCLKSFNSSATLLKHQRTHGEGLEMRYEFSRKNTDIF